MTSRRVKPFPASTFEDALLVPNTIVAISGGTGKARRITIFEQLGKSPESGGSRQLITNSGRYGLTVGSYSAEYIELSPEGKIAVDSDQSEKDRVRARFKLAIDSIEPFKKLYGLFSGAKLPSQAVMKDTLLESEVDKEDIIECIDTFSANAQFLGLIRTVAGTERLLTLDHALDYIKGASQPEEVRTGAQTSAGIGSQTVIGSPAIDKDWSKVCFYLSAIGDEISEERKHSNLFLGSFVEPAMEKLGLKVIRADLIGDAGMINSQVLEHLKKSRLAIADLSYRNPNVFYEMALRHALRLPVVQIIRKCDRIPFDVNQVRTVTIDTTDIFTLVPKIELYISEIAAQARAALENPDTAGNPVSVFYPKFFET